MAQGFVIAPNSYLRDYWNIFDFLLVIMSVFDILDKFLSHGLSSGLLNALRVFRLARFLRTIRLMPRVREVFSMVLKSIPGMMSAICLQFFCFIMMAILGLTIFSGKQYQACFRQLEIDGSEWQIFEDGLVLCSGDSDCEL